MPDTRKPRSADEATVSGWSARKQAAFAVVTVLLAVALSLGIVEYYLRYHDRQIAHSEHMEPGLISYNAALGWQLSPDWSGTHRHYDYTVQYHIDRNGFRADPQADKGHPRVAVLGDSFTFGLGVADDETFTSRLNAADTGRLNYLNLGTPGYSTDQELLLLQKTAKTIAPEVVLLVVYLANDLFDNQRPFPLQAEHGKPFFSLDTNGQLVAQNTPVPLTAKSAAARNTRLADVVLGDQKPRSPLLTRTLGRLRIARHLGIFQQQGQIDETVFEQHFDEALALFLALTDALQTTSQEAGAELVVALLPGGSFINHPQSLSARYQDFLRQQLVTGLNTGTGIKVIDLADIMRTTASKSKQQWYFPNEGHLTPAGHQFVAEVLLKELSD